MDTIVKSIVAQKLGVTIDKLKGYKFFLSAGDARTPERFWDYKALTFEELQSLPNTDSWTVRVIIND